MTGETFNQKQEARRATAPRRLTQCDLCTRQSEFAACDKNPLVSTTTDRVALATVVQALGDDALCDASFSSSAVLAKKESGGCLTELIWRKKFCTCVLFVAIGRTKGTGVWRPVRHVTAHRLCACSALDSCRSTNIQDTCVLLKFCISLFYHLCFQ